MLFEIKTTWNYSLKLQKIQFFAYNCIRHIVFLFVYYNSNWMFYQLIRIAILPPACIVPGVVQIVDVNMFHHSNLYPIH